MILNFIKKIFCELGWHSFPVGFETWIDPKDPLKFLEHGKCKWCGFVGLIDSQGNLF